MSKICKECDIIVTDNEAIFCGECGGKLEKEKVDNIVIIYIVVIAINIIFLYTTKPLFTITIIFISVIFLGIVSMKKENKKIKDRVKNGDFLIWKGYDIVEFEKLDKSLTFNEAYKKVIIPKNTEYLKEINQKLGVKWEFETILEYETREKKLEENRKLLKEDIFNAYLGEQDIELTYDADEEKFDVIIKTKTDYPYFFHSFKLKIPFNIAKEFKKSVKTIDIFYVDNQNLLIAVKAQKIFNGVKYEVELDF